MSFYFMCHFEHTAQSTHKADVLSSVKIIKILQRLSFRQRLSVQILMKLLLAHKMWKEVVKTTASSAYSDPWKDI